MLFYDRMEQGMKKVGIMTILIGFCCMLVCAGCSAINSVTSIVLLDSQEEIVVEVGKFNYDDYKFSVNYSNGTKKEIVLTEDMISDYDKLKLYQVGKQTITIKYENFSYEMNITVQRTSLDDIVFEDKTVVYTGESVVMEIEGGGIHSF